MNGLPAQHNEATLLPVIGYAKSGAKVALFSRTSKKQKVFFMIGGTVVFSYIMEEKTHAFTKMEKKVRISE